MSAHWIADLLSARPLLGRKQPFKKTNEMKFSVNNKKRKVKKVLKN